MQPRSGLKFTLLAILAIVGLGARAHAYEFCTVPKTIGLSDNDVSRLENLVTSRTRGLGGALRSENAADRASVAQLFEPGVPYAEPSLLAGDYRCRTIKLGGDLSPLTIYQWFSCRINEASEGTFTIEKLTGSQNFSGTLYPAGSGFAYKGASFYGYEDGARRYGDDPEQDQVGCLSAVTKDNQHFILELPFPPVESAHDVVELRPDR